MRDELPPFEPLDAAPGPALPLSDTEAAAQAQALVTLSRRRRRGTRVALLVAAALVVTTGAFAAVMVRELRAPAAPARSPRAARALPAPAPEPASEPEVTGLPAGPTLPAPASSHDWLELANAARARREFARAERLYLRVASSFPGTDDAEAANLSAAELRSQHLGRPRDAVPLYRKLVASARNRALAEQALVGLARAYAALGEHAAERAAWLELLRKYPESWFAEEARARSEPP